MSLRWYERLIFHGSAAVTGIALGHLLLEVFRL